jgi:hypothetical protein
MKTLQGKRKAAREHKDKEPGFDISHQLILSSVDSHSGRVRCGQGASSNAARSLYAFTNTFRKKNWSMDAKLEASNERQKAKAGDESCLGNIARPGRRSLL